MKKFLELKFCKPGGGGVQHTKSGLRTRFKSFNHILSYCRFHITRGAPDSDFYYPAGYRIFYQFEYLTYNKKGLLTESEVCTGKYFIIWLVLRESILL